MFSPFRSRGTVPASQARCCIRYADRLVRASTVRKENHVRKSKLGATDVCRRLFSC
jgi:hypothetical protein